MNLINTTNLSILHILFIAYLDTNKYIKLLEPKYELLRILNYKLWTLLSIYVLLYNENVFIIGDFITKSIILNYIYEIIYYKPDKAHLIHHIVTIATQLLSIYSGLYYIYWFQFNVFYTYLSLNTSIFSSLRHIVKQNCPKYYILTKNIYKFNFIICKISSMIPHYYNMYKYYNYDNNMEVLCLLTFFLIHIIQIYFSYMIILSYINL